MMSCASVFLPHSDSEGSQAAKDCARCSHTRAARLLQRLRNLGEGSDRCTYRYEPTVKWEKRWRRHKPDETTVGIGAHMVGEAHHIIGPSVVHLSGEPARLTQRSSQEYHLHVGPTTAGALPTNHRRRVAQPAGGTAAHLRP